MGLHWRVEREPCAKACLLEPRHRTFIWYTSDSQSVPMMMSSILTVFPHQLINDESDIVGWEENGQPANTYPSQEALTKAVQMWDVWAVPSGQQAWHPYLEHIFIYSLHYKVGLEEFKMASQLLCVLLFKKWTYSFIYDKERSHLTYNCSG